jgi:rare lipoprotein A
MRRSRRLRQLPSHLPLHPLHCSTADADQRRHLQDTIPSLQTLTDGVLQMADANQMSPQANVAASKTLPLCTTAKVINLQNGKSATVRMEDRGPFVAGRVMDVTFKVVQESEMSTHGVVPVEVKPIVVPQPNGEMKLGAGAAALTPQQVQQATRTTQSLPYERR